MVLVAEVAEHGARRFCFRNLSAFFIMGWHGARAGGKTLGTTATGRLANVSLT